MDQRVKGQPIAHLHGVEFTLVDPNVHVACHILPETLAYLRDRFLSGLRGSPIELFHQLREQILQLATAKLAAGSFESNGWLCLRVGDAIELFARAFREGDQVP